MKLSMPSGCSALSFLFIAAGALPAAADEALPDVLELRAELAETLSSYGTLAVEYRWLYMPELILDPRNRGEPHGGIRYTWRSDGKREYLRVSPPPEWGEAPPRESIWTGTVSYHALERFGLPKQVDISDVPPLGWQSEFSPGLFMGERLFKVSPSTLIEALALPQAKVARREAVEGSVCYVVEVDGLQFNKKTPYRVSAWLDPEHGHLARRITIYADDGKSQWYRTFQTLEYTRVSGPDGQGSFWFPKVGAMIQLIGEYRFVFDDVRVNVPLSDSEFAPKMPAGTNVYDHRPGIVAPRSYLVGGSAATDDAVVHLAAMARSAAEREATVASATPRPGFSNSQWVLFLGLTGLATAAATVAVKRIKGRL
jgi:hypothetical protein